LNINMTIDVQPDLSENITFVISYDTCTHAATIPDFPLPPDSTLVAAWDEVGPLADTEHKNGHTNEVDFAGNTQGCPGAEAAHLAVARQPRPDAYAPFHDRRFAEAWEGNMYVTLHVPDGLFIPNLSPATDQVSADGRTDIMTNWSASASSLSGPHYVFEDHRDPNWTFLDESPFRLVVPTEYASQAADLVGATLPFINATRAEAGAPRIQNATYLIFTPRINAHDSQHLSGEFIPSSFDPGVLLRAPSSYDGSPDAIRESLMSLGTTLVHESFHAMTTQRPLNATWWIEGTAVHAQHAYETAHGWTCSVQGCRAPGASMPYTQLAGIYANATFDPAWRLGDPRVPAGYPLYGHWGFAVDAYVQRYGEKAYAAAWHSILENESQPNCASDTNLVLHALSDAAGRPLQLSDVFFPYLDLFRSNETAFREAVGPLVNDDRSLPLPPAPAARAYVFTGITHALTFANTTYASDGAAPIRAMADLNSDGNVNDTEVAARVAQREAALNKSALASASTLDGQLVWHGSLLGVSYQNLSGPISTQAPLIESIERDVSYPASASLQNTHVWAYPADTIHPGTPWTIVAPPNYTISHAEGLVGMVMAPDSSRVTGESTNQTLVVTFAAIPGIAPAISEKHATPSLPLAILLGVVLTVAASRTRRSRNATGTSTRSVCGPPTRK
jgi:hypothetical protein